MAVEVILKNGSDWKAFCFLLMLIRLKTQGRCILCFFVLFKKWTEKSYLVVKDEVDTIWDFCFFVLFLCLKKRLRVFFWHLRKKTWMSFREIVKGENGFLKGEWAHCRKWSLQKEKEWNQLFVYFMHSVSHHLLSC